MKMRFIFFLILGILLCQKAYSQQTVNLKKLLMAMQKHENVARFPEPVYSQKQVSSYDRRSKIRDSAGWFANSDFNQFIREENIAGRQEYVMMDEDGPGAIVRFWLTCLEKPGTMRFYFDLQEEPTIVVPGFDLLKAGLELGPALLNPHTNYEPTGKGGNTLYLPLVFNTHCKVTWEFANEASKEKPHYYQINYRIYPKEVKAETFSFEQVKRLKKEIDETEGLLWKPRLNYLMTDSVKKNLAPGESCMLNIDGKNSAIHLLKVKIGKMNSEKESLWRNLLLKISFDNQETVLCPLGDFIGSGYGGREISSWYRDLSKSKELTARWVMPFRKTAKINLLNHNDFPLELELSVARDQFKWDERSMYFHALYKSETNVWDAKWDYDPQKDPKKDNRAPIDWNFIAFKGKGVYMGNTLATFNHMNTWYGEGDAKIYVDHESFPSEFGTGLEDYYNTSWAPVIIYQTPFANATRADSSSSKGHNTFTRTRILDAIPFKENFSYDMEMLSWDSGYVDVSATTYWYATPQ